jgi:adenylate cyclase
VQPQQEQRVERRLAAIFAADVAGYSRLMSQDEAGTLRALAAAREVMDGLISAHGGRIANTAGDSVLAEFPSAVDAVQCAVVVQEKLSEVNVGDPEDRLQFRIGVHVGDVVVRGGDLLGDGVNVAARLEGLAEPGGIAISGAAHGYVRKALPLAYTDLGEQEVKNIDGPFRVYSVNPAAPRRAAIKRKPLPLPDKPSIAVMPFTNMSGDPEHEYFADGIVEDVITALSRIKAFFVIARNTTFTYKGQAVGVSQIRRELGVRYVLEGSVRKAADRLRITGQLIETRTGHHVWADRFEGSVADVFDLQDRVSAAVACAIEPEIRAVELARIRAKRPETLDAYDLYLQALSRFYAVERHENEHALILTGQALERDPTYAAAHALRALCWHQRRQQGWVEDARAAEREGGISAESALSFDTNDPQVLLAAGHVLGTMGRQYARGRSLIDQSLALNPNSAQGWAISAWHHIYAAEGREAIAELERALRLSPRDSMSHYIYAGFAAAHCNLRQFDEAKQWAERAIEERPAFAPAYRWLAVALVNRGEQQNAESTIRRLLQLEPGLTINTVATARTSHSVESDREFYLSSLRRAGLPE